ncbi:hypothetical protein LIER_32721 [Lithospermum erythrorhizon]|uniref:Uncharacterized protein n=1 Tax=Lithospermum erythrorhizon TaxID=34254 RepID=A0AAV3RUP1_LITER
MIFHASSIIRFKPLPSFSSPILVVDLTLSSRSWNMPFLHSFFPPHIVSIIRKIKVSSASDKFIWDKGKVSTKALYNASMKRLKPTPPIPSSLNVAKPGVWKKIWKLPIPHKCKVLI